MPEYIPIPFPGETLYFGEPGLPLVVVLHDWYGRTPGLVPFAEALARTGLRVAVPDLYDGVCTTDPLDAETLMTGLEVAIALATVDDVIRDALEEGSTRVGVLGFSMGGWLALLHAQGGGADAVVAYYATLAESEDGVIPCPVLLQLAEVDDWAPGAEPADFVARLQDYGTPVTQHSYLGARHSFANATIRDAFDANAAALAFARSATFLEKHLVD